MSDLLLPTIPENRRTWTSQRAIDRDGGCVGGAWLIVWRVRSVRGLYRELIGCGGQEFLGARREEVGDLDERDRTGDRESAENLRNRELFSQHKHRCGAADHRLKGGREASEARTDRL